MLELLEPAQGKELSIMNVTTIGIDLAKSVFQGPSTHDSTMARFRQIRSLQKFAAAHASVHNHFNHDRSLERRSRFKDLRQAALTEWRELLVA